MQEASLFFIQTHHICRAKDFPIYTVFSQVLYSFIRGWLTTAILQTTFIALMYIKLSVRQVTGPQTLPQVLCREFLLPRILLLFPVTHFSSASSEVLRWAEGKGLKNVSAGETAQLSCNRTERGQRSPSIIYPCKLIPNSMVQGQSGALITLKYKRFLIKINYGKFINIQIFKCFIKLFFSVGFILLTHHKIA